MAGLSQEELAERSGLSVRAIANMEGGRTARPYRRSVRLLADALELPSSRREQLARASRRDVGIVPSAEAPDVGQFPPVTPRELPAAVRYFAGRRAELDALTGLLSQAKGAPGTVVISAIGGTAGVGKTALAVYWAHQVAERFPDGQLYVNLRGFDPSREPVEPATAVRGFLDALGVAAERVPASPQAQAGLYRSLLADKRVLIVLDNARDEDQVRHLLPASPGCLVVVTSRTQLAGMVAAEGAMPIALDVLTEPEAHQLLAQRLGEGRVTAEPAAVTELVNLCARLPLALAVTAARAAAYPGFRLSALAAELRDARTRLTALDAVDPAASVQAVFCWSYEQLSPSAARMFRLLAVHPGPDITVAAAASLAGAPPPHTRRFVAELVRSSLVTEHAPGRFAFHDLLRAYAQDQNRRGSAAAQTSAAVHRTLDHYLHTACHADRLLGVSRATITVTMPTDGVTPESLHDNDSAMAWFKAEHDVLMAVVRLAAEQKFDTHAWQIPWALVRYLDWTGNWNEWAATQRTALAAAERLGDQAGQAHAHRFLGDAHARLGSCHDTRTHLSRARELYRQIGDRVGEAHSRIRLAMTAELEGDFADALSNARQALDLYAFSGDRPGQAHALNAVGWCHVLLGDFAQALGYCGRALDLHREFGNKYGQAAAWDSLGYAHHHLGDHSLAIACYQQAIYLHSTVGDRCDQAEVLGRLAETYHAAGDTQTARDLWRQALAILDELHSPGAGRIRARLESVSPR